MRSLGLLFVLAGLWMCFSFLFLMPGLSAVGVGALLYIAGAKAPHSPVRRVVNGSLWALIVGSLALVALLFVGAFVRASSTPKLSGASVAAPHSMVSSPRLAQRAKPAKASLAR